MENMQQYRETPHEMDGKVQSVGEYGILTVDEDMLAGETSARLNNLLSAQSLLNSFLELEVSLASSRLEIYK